MNISSRRRNAGNIGSSRRKSAWHFKVRTVAGVLGEVSDMWGDGEEVRSGTNTSRDSFSSLFLLYSLILFSTTIE